MILFLFSIVLILACTLSTLGAVFMGPLPSLTWHSFILGWGRLDDLDILANILLFLPMGFSLARCLRVRQKLRTVAAPAVVLLVAVSLSYSIEVVQGFLPSRFSSLIDVLSNTLGGLLGLLCFRLWELRNLQLTLVAYVTLAFIFSILLQRSTNLTSWDDTFSLFFGNEATGDRPWQGYVSDVFIFDRALTGSEIKQAFSSKNAFNPTETIFAYGRNSMEDIHGRTGQFPELIPDGPQNGKVMLGPNHWLQTAGPATKLSRRMMETSQFTVSVTAATHNTIQTGPARIVSLSRDPDQRNFTLGQQESDLVFRLRTLVTGKNGSNPSLVVPDVFSTQNPQNLMITYDGARLLLYVNGVRSLYTLELTPGAAACGYFFRLNAFSAKFCKLLYYAFVFTPLGVLFSLATAGRGNHFTRFLVISGAGLLSSLLLEGILVGVSGKTVSLENVLLSITWVTAGIAGCHILKKQLSPVTSLRQQAVDWAGR